MANCKYCYRSIPKTSIYCPYCGKEYPINKGIRTRVKKFTTEIEMNFRKAVPKIKEETADFLKQVKNTMNSSKRVPSFVNRGKISATLDSLVDKIQHEKDSQKVREYQAWANLIEESISGNKCIVCLQEFSFASGATAINVLLCPNCNYAAHKDHFNTWMQHKNVCPICKTEINMVDLRSGLLTLKEAEIVFTSK